MDNEGIQTERVQQRDVLPHRRIDSDPALIEERRLHVIASSRRFRNTRASLRAAADPSRVPEELKGIPVVIPANHGGLIARYFHFTLGYYLPALAAVHALDPQTPIAVVDSGVHTPRWAEAKHTFIPVSAATAYDIAAQGESEIAIHGFDGLVPRAKALRDAARLAANELGVRHERAPQDREDFVLIVDRGQPGPGSASNSPEARRSVANMEEIADRLGGLAAVNRCDTAELRMADQVRAFRDATIVVLQHGAAAADLIWCRPGTTIIELSPPRFLPRFVGLLDSLRLRHVQIGQANEHAPVDVEEVVFTVRETIEFNTSRPRHAGTDKEDAYEVAEFEGAHDSVARPDTRGSRLTAKTEFVTDPVAGSSPRPFLGLGHPRCGTGFTAGLLHSSGLDIGHERIHENGMVSWMAISERKRVPWGVSYGRIDPQEVSIFLVARSPLTAIGSIMGEDLNRRSFAWRAQVLWERADVDICSARQVPQTDLGHAVASYTLWFEECLQFAPQMIFRVDHAEDDAALSSYTGVNVLRTPDVPRNSRPGKHKLIAYSPESLQTLPPRWFERLDAVGQALGYAPLDQLIEGATSTSSERSTQPLVPVDGAHVS